MTVHARARKMDFFSVIVVERTQLGGMWSGVAGLNGGGRLVLLEIGVVVWLVSIDGEEVDVKTDGFDSSSSFPFFSASPPPTCSPSSTGGTSSSSSA